MIEWTRLVTDNPVNKMGYESTMKALETGERQKPYLLEVFKKDGNKVLLEIEESPLKNEEGKVMGIIGAARDVTERKRTEDSLKDQELQLRTLSDNLPNSLVYQIDSGEDGQQRRFAFISSGIEKMHGITTTEALNDARTIYNQVIEEDRIRLTAEEALAAATMSPFSTEVRLRLPSGELRWRFFTSAPRRLRNNHLVWDGIEIDITEQKKTEEILREKESELQIKAKNLEEMNTALKVLLQKRDEDRVEVEEKILLNMRELVTPYLEKIKKGGLDKIQSTHADILESHLKDIVSSFSYRLSSTHLNLTPSEIKVANLVKQGKTNKEIADLLNISTRTAAFHRERIRKKLGIKNQKTNLRSYLASIN
jgi:PAS domain S-box-containing protein